MENVIIFLSIILGLTIFGWAITIKSSVKRCLKARMSGEAAGYSRGCREAVARINAMGKKKTKKKVRR